MPIYVKFLGATDAQVKWAGGADPREYLEIGQLYKLERKEEHSWHTRYILFGFPDCWFNSVCFEIV